MDGFCNNLEHPKWGATSTPYNRLFDALYDDGVRTIRKSVTFKDLPSPRFISNQLLEQSAYVKLPKQISNAIAYNYGMFIAHDAGKMAMYQSSKYKTACLKLHSGISSCKVSNSRNSGYYY